MGNSDDQEKRFAASCLFSAYLFANVVSVAPALALSVDDFTGTSQVVAAKSGGRMGGRSSSGARPSSSSYKPSSSTTTERTTVIRQPVIQSPVVVAPPVVAPPVYGGYGYGVDAGAVGKLSNEKELVSCTCSKSFALYSLGLSVGLNAINSIGREMREQSQEREIAREREELAEARMKAAELEGRLRALEAGR